MIHALLEELTETMLRRDVEHDVFNFLELCEGTEQEISDSELEDVAHFFWFQRGAGGFFTEEELQSIDVIVEAAFDGDILDEEIDGRMDEILLTERGAIARWRTAARQERRGITGAVRSRLRAAKRSIGRGAAAVGRRVQRGVKAASIRGRRRVQRTVSGVRQRAGAAIQRAGARVAGGRARTGQSTAHVSAKAVRRVGNVGSRLGGRRSGTTRRMTGKGGGFRKGTVKHAGGMRTGVATSGVSRQAGKLAAMRKRAKRATAAVPSFGRRPAA